MFPAVNINLHSNKLQFTLNDEVLKRQTRVVSTGQTVALGVSQSAGHDSHFSFGNPVYNLGFTLTPGIDARLFIDVAVWSHNWDWPVWFPQLSVDLPPNGIDFGCHAGTTCVPSGTSSRHDRRIASGAGGTRLQQGRQHDGLHEVAGLPGLPGCGEQAQLLRVQSCGPGIVLKEEQSADKTLTGGKCERKGGKIGEYLCPIQGGMLALCNTMLNNGAVLRCDALVPTSADQILKRGGCKDDGGKAGAYQCPSGMIGLCELYLKNGVILSCKQGN